VINLSEATKNQGSGATMVNTVTRFYWSTNTTYNASDVPLGERTVGPLAAGETSGPVDTSVTIPPTAVTGTYYIIAWPDADKSVAETSETNNRKYIKVKIP
jgi:subtilase family serine protease